jgi:glycosyltransferase involved in cell wall biosynthesis
MINSLSLIIPVYNEEDNVKNYLENYIKYLNQSNINYEIIIVESNSTDDTHNEIEYFRKFKSIKIIYENKKKGYGSAVKLGLEKSTKEFFTIFPIDNQYSIKELINLCIENDANLITFRKVNFTSKFKKLRSLIFRNLTNLIFNFKYLSNSWIIDLEFLILISQSKLKINEVGIKMKDRQYGNSKVTIYDNLSMILGLLVTKLKFFF